MPPASRQREAHLLPIDAPRRSKGVEDDPPAGVKRLKPRASEQGLEQRFQGVRAR